MPPYYLTVRLPSWLVHDYPCDPNKLLKPTPFFRVQSKAGAMKLKEMFRTNDPKISMAFLFMHERSRKMAGAGEDFALPMVDVVDSGQLTTSSRTRFVDDLRKVERQAVTQSALPESDAVLKEYHLRARQWEVDALEPREDGLPSAIAVFLGWDSFPRLTKDEFAKLGAWLASSAQSLEQTKGKRAQLGRLKAICDYNATLYPQDSKAVMPPAAKEPPVPSAPGHQQKRKKRGRPPLSSQPVKLRLYKRWSRAWHSNRYNTYAECAAEMGGNTRAEDIANACSAARKHPELFRYNRRPK